MAVNGIVQDGQIVESAAQKSAQSAQKSTPDGYDKEAFLKLLVAQMKYQDPMEPTDNSEYITQYATFSQVEQMQNMAQSLDLSRASTMVGQTVQITSEGADGKTKQVEGVVDYVTYENNKAFVSVNGEKYAVEDVTGVIDKNYFDATDLANTFADGMDKLPALYNLTVGDRATLTDLYNLYNNMGEYAQSFVNPDYVTLLSSYMDRMKQLILAAEEAAQNTAQSDPEQQEEVPEEKDPEVEAVNAGTTVE